MRRFTALFFAFVLVLAACGGSEADTTTTAPSSDAASGNNADDDDGGGGDNGQSGSSAATTQATTEATSPPDISFGDFCDDGDTPDTLVDGIDFFNADLEATVTQWLAAMEAIEDAAPDEIRADVGVIVEAARQLAELLAEVEYDFLQLDPDDERLAVFEDGTIDAAADNIAAYCGWDVDASEGNGGSGGSGGFGNDEIPEDVPSELIPPDITSVVDAGVAGLNIETTASFDEMVALYSDVLGAPTSTEGNLATFDGTIDGSTVVVFVQAIDNGGTLVTLLIISV